MAAYEFTPLLQANQIPPVLDDGEGITPKQRKKASYLIIAAKAFERLVFYSISGILLVYLTNESLLCLSNREAFAVIFLFNAVSNVFCLVAGVISDSFISRYKSIIIGYVIYFIGYLIWGITMYSHWRDMVDSSSTVIRSDTCKNRDHANAQWESDKDIMMKLTTLTLFIISIAAAIVRSNLAAFGASQIRIFGSIQTRSFMTMYYWGTNFGSTVVFLGLSFMHKIIKNASALLVGFLIISLFLSFILFVAGNKLYIKRRAESRFVVKDIVKVISNARMVKKNNPQIKEKKLLEYSNMAKGYPGAECTLQEIKNTKNMCQIFKVVLLMIPYWICYSHVNGTLYLLQGLHMDLELREHHLQQKLTCYNRWQLRHSPFFHNQSASINDYFPTRSGPTVALLPEVIGTGIIVIILPFVHNFYRCLTKCCVIVYTYRRLVCGMLLAFLSLLAAGILETVRIDHICAYCTTYKRSEGTVCGMTSEFGVLYQSFQYLLMGSSEILFIVTGLEYIYMKSPPYMQGLSMGLFWFSSGIGYFIGWALTALFQVTENINSGSLDVYFYFLAFLLGVYTPIFYICCTYFHLGLHRMIIIPLPEDPA